MCRQRGGLIRGRQKLHVFTVWVKGAAGGQKALATTLPDAEKLAYSCCNKSADALKCRVRRTTAIKWSWILEPDIRLFQVTNVRVHCCCCFLCYWCLLWIFGWTTTVRLQENSFLKQTMNWLTPDNENLTFSDESLLQIVARSSSYCDQLIVSAPQLIILCVQGDVGLSRASVIQIGRCQVSEWTDKSTQCRLLCTFHNQTSGSFHPVKLCSAALCKTPHFHPSRNNITSLGQSFL